MHPCHGGSNQQWYFDDRGQMHSVRDGKCLDQHMENNNVYMHNCHGDRNQSGTYDPGRGGLYILAPYLGGIDAGRSEEWRISKIF